MEDMGDFEEGYCFKIIANVGSEEAWILCVASPDLKERWMNAVTLVKGKYTAFDADAKWTGTATITGYSLD
jgi:hypothetical protein